MPIPSATKGETQDKFMNRCMSSEVMKKEFPEQKQRVAVCMNKWREHSGGKKPEAKSEENK